jgi:hypothetical protein
MKTDGFELKRTIQGKKAHPARRTITTPKNNNNLKNNNLKKMYGGVNSDWDLKTLGTAPVRIKKANGYISANDLCRACNRRFGDYSRLQVTEQFIETVRQQMPNEKLLITKLNGPNWNRGTWVHPIIATHLAVWLSPRFASQVMFWIEEWRSRNRRRYLNSLCNIEGEPVDMRESRIRNFLAMELNAKSEVPCEAGICDLLVPKESIYEIKYCIHWKDALGKILAYSACFRRVRLKKVIFLFGNFNNINVSFVRKVYRRHQVELRLFDESYLSTEE